jgi:hypothetical protein
VVVLAGLPFSFEPEGELSRLERAALRELAEADPDAGSSRLAPFRVVLHPRATQAPGPPDATPEAAQVSWAGDRCQLRHLTFEAELDALRGEARIWRSEGSAIGVLTTLRTALCCRLPLEGGLVLHAAGLVRESAGLVFCGPSGAGKTTLAARSPWPVLSDELVAVLPEGETSFSVRRTPFRKAPPGDARAARGAAPLVALVELDKGPYRLARLGRTEALRALVASAAVPAGPPLWTAALAAIGRLVREVPCYRMTWSLDEAPFPRLADALRLPKPGW